ncbi:MAG: hypothetical protein ACFFD2_17040 [Promethearchaeota archaeon]
MEKTCKYCGAILLTGICPVCHRSELVTPKPLMSATLFDLNPHLKKRLEWREKIRRNLGMYDLPFDPTKLNAEDLPPKTLPDYIDFPREKKKNPDTLEI